MARHQNPAEPVTGPASCGEEPDVPTCEHCGGEMTVYAMSVSVGPARLVRPDGHWVSEHSQLEQGICSVCHKTGPWREIPHVGIGMVA